MAPAPRLLSLTTSVPDHVIRQDDVKAWARRFFDGANGPNLARLLPAFDNAGIETRRSVVPLSWFDSDHGWEEKNRLYLDNATDLLERAAQDCLDQAGVSAESVDAVVTVSTSGIATPSLDARLLNRLGFRSDVQRLPIFGLGCAGGVLGLARAAELARAEPGRHVLFLVVELCGITFRHADRSKSNVIATALFGDGAAAALLGSGKGPAVTAWGEHTWPDTLSVMGWDVHDDGLGVVFSQDIPALVRREMKNAVDRYLAKSGQGLADIDGYACHPGGTKVLQALEDCFGLPEGGLDAARSVLRDYGNMSAATVMFVLRRMLSDGTKGRLLLSALGPGFTVAFLTLETQ
jgi:alkylresorcinol/alkylpyrone synthase